MSQPRSPLCSPGTASHGLLVCQKLTRTGRDAAAALGSAARVVSGRGRQRGAAGELLQPPPCREERGGGRFCPFVSKQRSATANAGAGELPHHQANAEFCLDHIPFPKNQTQNPCFPTDNLQIKHGGTQTVLGGLSCFPSAQEEPADEPGGETDSAHPAPTTAAHTGTHGATRHGTAEGTWHRGGDTHVPGGQSHIPSRGTAGGAGRRGVCWRGVHPWEGGWVPAGAEVAEGESFFPARRGSREVRAPRCPRPGPAFSHGMLKSFPFVETKILFYMSMTSSSC